MPSGHRSPHRAARALVTTSATVLLGAGLLATPAAAAPRAPVVGQVVAFGSHAPVAGARVTLPDFGLRTTSGRDGRFAIPGTVAAAWPDRRVSVVVTAAGFGRWTLRRAPLVPGQALEIYAELRRHAYTHTFLTAGERVAGPGRQAPISSYTFTCTGWAYSKVPPPTIKVWITDDGVSQQYDFLFYVAHVLPKEWISSWDDDALGAGAVAARTFGHYRTKAGHAYSGGSGCADVTDGPGDQVFDPTVSYPSTDQAVDATFGSILFKDGNVWLAQYYAGMPDDPCAPVVGEFKGRMSQWGTETCATEGVLWPDITTTFYDTATWTVPEFQNLLLDPSFDSPATYAWITTATTTTTRVKGDSYDGNWHELVTPDTGKNATLREERPFAGAATTLYHAQAALRCETSNTTSCTITMKVIAVPTTGSSVTRSTTIVLANDGQWSFQTFDPAAAGISHATVWLSFVTKQAISVDDATLNGPFGGP